MKSNSLNKSSELIVGLFDSNVCMSQLSKKLNVDEKILMEWKNDLLSYTTKLLNESIQKSDPIKKTRSIQDVKKSNDFLMKVLK